MLDSYTIYFVISFLVCDLEAAAKRHMIYWNSFMTPELSGKNDDYILNVKIGEFLDVLCPQTSLMSITNGPHEPDTFDLFNVTKQGFEKCDRSGKSNFVFACDRPEREKKLTIKFQTISPSPLGFRFRYCEDYYIVALPRHKQDVTRSGCDDKNSTRLHIKVGCKYKPTTTVRTTTTSSTTTSSTTSMSTAYTTPFDSLFDLEKDMTENIVHPKIVQPRYPRRNITLGENLDGAKEKQTGENGGSICNCVTPLYILTSLLASLFMRLLTSPIT